MTQKLGNKTKVFDATQQGFCSSLCHQRAKLLTLTQGLIKRIHVLDDIYVGKFIGLL